MWFDRIAIVNTSFGFWNNQRETLERIMGRQAIGMTFDYPESQPFCKSSGGAISQLDWIVRYLEEESYITLWHLRLTFPRWEHNIPKAGTQRSPLGI